MRETCTILPLKAFGKAKSRLSSILSIAERATIARLMAMDVLQALSAVPEAGRIVIAGQGAEHTRLAAQFHCDFVEDDPALDVSENVARAARLPTVAHAETLFYLPADLPLLTARDIHALLAQNGEGLTLCRASRDGGTNAMLATPPVAASFSFGSHSAGRHAAAARAAGWPVSVLDIAAFQRDIDEPRDLAWLCRHGLSGATVEYVRHANFEARLADSPLAALAY